MDFKVIHIEETDSTNRWLKEHGEGETLVVAEYQTAGKGCGSNSWESEKGKNLTFSMLIHPDITAHDQFRITEVTSVALCETLAPYIYNKVEIKWPNDIYIGDKKICGMLIENRLQGSTVVDSIIGIGLNVNQRVFESDAPNPVSMWQLLGQDTDREALLQRFLQKWDALWHSDSVAADYRCRLYRKGAYAVYQDKGGQFEAQIINVEPDGHLLLRDSEECDRRYAFKEVQFIIS